MPLHRRKVYLDNSLSRHRQAENWLAYSIVLAAVILIISAFGSLSDVAFVVSGWFLPHEMPNGSGEISAVPQFLTELCEFLAVISGAYLALALLIRSVTRHGPH